MSEQIEKYRKTLEINPSNTEALNGMATAALAENKDEIAEDYYRLALLVDHRNTEAMNGMAMLCRRGRMKHLYEPISDEWLSNLDRESMQLEDAEAWYRNVLTIDPENWTAQKGFREVTDAMQQDLNIISMDCDGM